MDESVREMLPQVLANAPNIAVILNQDGIMLYVSQGAPGVAADDVVGKHHLDFMEPKYRAMAKEAVAGVFQTGEPAEYELEGRGTDGGVAWYSSLVRPIMREDEIVAVSIYAVDITERKNAEEALRGAKDELIEKQAEALRELSTPVIQVWDEVLILPLIGTIDTARAQQVIESLLESIVGTQAAVAIMDITGVPVVDTLVANHLLKTIQAAKLLGTEVILTGVSADMAQTLVALGVTLDNIVTKGSLQAGLRLAFEITGRAVVTDTRSAS